MPTPILVTTKRLALRDEIFERHSFLFFFYSLFYISRAGPFLPPTTFCTTSSQIYNLPTAHSQHQGGEMDMHTELSKPSRHAVDMLLISWW